MSGARGDLVEASQPTRRAARRQRTLGTPSPVQPQPGGESTATFETPELTITYPPVGHAATVRGNSKGRVGLGKLGLVVGSVVAALLLIAGTLWIVADQTAAEQVIADGVPVELGLVAELPLSEVETPPVSAPPVVASGPPTIQITAEGATLSGAVGTEEEALQIVAAASRVVGGGRVTSDLAVVAGTETSPSMLFALGAILGQLPEGSTGELELGGDNQVGGELRLPDDADLRAVQAVLTGLADSGTQVAVTLTLQGAISAVEAGLVEATAAEVATTTTAGDAATGSASDEATGEAIDPGGLEEGLAPLVPLVAEQVRFEFDSAELTPEATALLVRVAAVVTNYPDEHITITAHTDSKGGEWYNNQLSRRRAEAVMELFSSVGIDQGRMSATGRGGEDPLADNETLGGRKQNRRVEIAVVTP